MEKRFTPRTSSKLQAKKRRILAAKILTALIAIVVFVSGLSWLSFADAFSVREVRVQGNESVRARAIEAAVLLQTAGAYASIFSKQNVALYPSDHLQKVLVFDFPRIKSVGIDRKVTQSAAVFTVTERKPYALWCKEALSDEKEHGRCYYLDEEGFAFERAAVDVPESGEHIVFLGGTLSERGNPIRGTLNPEQFGALRALLLGLEESFGVRVQEISINGTEASIFVAPGWELKIALDKSLEAVLANLSAVLGEYGLLGHPDNIEYIDLRFDERAYYKLRE